MASESARLRPDSAIIAIAKRSIATEPHVKAKILFPGVHRDRPADRGGGGAGAVGRDRGAGIGAVFQFWRAAAAPAASAAAQRRPWRLVRRRPVRAVPAAAGAEAGREFFQGAAAGEARNRAGSQ